MHQKNNFDMIRLIAASQVIFNHTILNLHVPNVPIFLMPFVDALPGVPIFFVVSGFLVTRSFVEGSDGIAGYAMRRGLRIYPALWMHYLVILAALALTGALAFETLFTAAFWQWIAGAFILGSDFWGNLAANAYPFGSTGFYKGFPSGVVWTISVELGFYLLVPFVFARYIRERSLAWLPILICGAASLYFEYVLMREYAAYPSHNTTAELFCSPLPYFWVFLIGATISIYWDLLKHLFIGKFLIWAVGYAILTWSDLHYFGKAKIDLVDPVGLTIPRMFVLGGLVVAFAYSFPKISRWIKADISYGAYLYHMPLILTLAGLGFSGDRWLWIVTYAGTFTIAALSWFLIEKPALGLKRHSGRVAAFVRRVMPDDGNQAEGLPVATAPSSEVEELQRLIQKKNDEILFLKLALADATMAARPV